MTQTQCLAASHRAVDYSNSIANQGHVADPRAQLHRVNVKDHLYQNVIAIDGQNPGNLGARRRWRVLHLIQYLQRAVPRKHGPNEGAGPAGLLLRNGQANPASNVVVWDISRGSLPQQPALWREAVTG